MFSILILDTVQDQPRFIRVRVYVSIEPVKVAAKQFVKEVIIIRLWPMVI